MNKTTKIRIVMIAAIMLVIATGLYFLVSFFSGFAPPKLTITKDFIATNQHFVNGVTIEKIEVDSMGDHSYPVKYTVVYSTSCNIHYLEGKHSDSPDKIAFYKPGNYSWVEDTTQVHYIHNGLERESTDTASKLWSLKKFGNHPTCPLKFEKEQWYFITIGHPQVTGVFFRIDSSGKEHKYTLESGISPI